LYLREPTSKGREGEREGREEKGRGERKGEKEGDGYAGPTNCFQRVLE